MRRTAINLADGRELIYFDADHGIDRTRRDQRELEPAGHASEIRYDRLLDQWVIVAAHRQRRTFQPSAHDCPLCPSRPGISSEVPAYDYDVVVFENRFPALSAAGDATTDELDDFVYRSGVGRCEVVCFTADHDASFADLTPAQVDLVVEAWIDRTQELSALPGVEQVFCFENRGKDIGVTLEHPHGQIYAYPFVTPRTQRMLAAASAHSAKMGRNLADEVLAAERAEQTRVVASTADWTAFVPFAARWPYEVHIYPNERVPDLAALSPSARSQFSELYLDVLRRFDRLFGERIPYISAIHQAPVRHGRDELPLHVELFTSRRAPGKLKYLAGSEAAMEAYANDVRPEVAAERLRNASPHPGAGR